jgi:hypothetical protein
MENPPREEDNLGNKSLSQNGIGILVFSVPVPFWDRLKMFAVHYVPVQNAATSHFPTICGTFLTIRSPV